MAALCACRRSTKDWEESAFRLDPFERRMAALALREVRFEEVPRAVKGLEVLARDPDGGVRSGAEDSLRALAAEVVVAGLAPDRDPALERALLALGDRAVAALLELAQRADPTDRAEVERMLLLLDGSAARVRRE